MKNATKLIVAVVILVVGLIVIGSFNKPSPRVQASAAASLPQPKPCVDVEFVPLLVGIEDSIQSNAQLNATGEAHPKAVVTNNCPYRVDVDAEFRVNDAESGMVLHKGKVTVDGLLPGKVGRKYYPVTFNSGTANLAYVGGQYWPAGRRP